MKRRCFLFVLAFAGILAAQPRQQDPKRVDAVRERYTKQEFLVPMRDGVRLFTAVYTPKQQREKYPILLNRTPYTVAPYGSDNYRQSLGPSQKFQEEGFVFVYQDVRGKGRSEGQFVHVRPFNPNKQTPKDIDEASDTYDTIEWLLKNVPNNNGRVGMWGISYPGFYAAMGVLSKHPALKASSPQAPVTDWFIGDDFRHNGALFLTHAFNFLSMFGRPRAPENSVPGPRFNMETPDGYDFFLRSGPLQNIDEKYFRGQIEYWRELLQQDTYDSYWQARNMRPHFRGMTAAMMTVGGWFDAEDLFGPLRLYDANEAGSPGSVNTLVMGPWIHGGWAGEDGNRLGAVRFDSNTSKYYQEEIEFPFFLHHLKDKAPGRPLPEAYMFETGRNEWHRLEKWPPPSIRPSPYFLQPGGKLGPEQPAEPQAYDEYVSDPAKPVPFVGFITNQMDVTYMVADQRFAASRPDVLVFQTEPLEHDLRIAGPIKVTLYVSTTSTDADFVVKLIDVYPGDAPDPNPNPRNERMGGYQQLVRGEPFRGKFRTGFDNPQPFTPGKVERIEFELPDTFHAFRRGHRVMVQVQSSWFPLVDRNPQKFLKIHEARSEDFVKATHRVHRSAQAASQIVLPVLP
jgi:putative CocE/NonD family hydrolase